MANNFRITGNVYVSKEGNDANSGLTPDLPKLTVQAGLTILTNNQILVIGAGYYSESLSRNGLTGISIIADGVVILDGIGLYSIFIGQGVTMTMSVYNIIFQNYSSILGTGATNQGVTHNYYNCTFINCNVTLIGGSSNGATQLQLYKCICIISSFYVSFATQPVTFYCLSSIFIRSTVTGKIIKILDSYFDSTCSISDTYGSLTAANFDYNNIQGKIAMNTGTYAGIALSFADHQTYYPTYNVNSISADPLFNNPQNLNFTLQSTSPNIGAASDYITNIGGTEYAKYYNVSDSVFSGGTITNLAYQGDGLLGAYTISAGTSGNIITQPMQVQSYPGTKPLTGILLEGDLQFNKSITAPAQGNQNVPAYDTYTSGAGATPDRLKIKMRYSTQSASPIAGQWDNGGYWTVDTYQLVEVNVKPKVDSNGIGNGDYTYLEFSGLGDLVPTWIQLDIKLRNDYAI